MPLGRGRAADIIDPHLGGSFAGGMSRILLAVSDRWVPDNRVDAIGDLVQRPCASVLAVHVAYGTEESGADVTPGEKLLDQIARQLRLDSIATARSRPPPLRLRPQPR